MNSATPALLALLLVVSLVAVPVAAGPGEQAYDRPQATLQAQEQQPDRQVVTYDDAADETSTRLELDGEPRSEYIEYGADFGTLLTGVDDELRTDYDQYVLLDREFEDATNEEREELLDAAYENVKDRTAELESREQDAVNEHARGDLSTNALLQTLLRNYNEAVMLQDALDDLDRRADETSGYSLSVQDDQDELETHRTPVRAYLESAARGQASSDALLTVETTDAGEGGYALSVLDGSYVREATVFDNRRPPTWASDFDDITDAFEHAAELYPWVFENAQSPSANEHTSVNLYRIQASHDQGRLEAYLDGWTTDVYREVQVLSPTELPTETETTWTTEELNLTVNQTPANGPVEVTVTDAETGDPERATVTVDGFEIGTTDRDGSIWFAPPAESFELTVETESGNLDVTVPSG